jgi:hypothetical protein
MSLIFYFTRVIQIPTEILLKQSFERILSCGWKQKACDTKQFNIKPNRQKKRFPAT